MSSHHGVSVAHLWVSWGELTLGEDGESPFRGSVGVEGEVSLMLQSLGHLLVVGAG